ncbi:maltotransferase domain-containing protein [Achromobacter xylosoxidans]
MSAALPVCAAPRNAAMLRNDAGAQARVAIEQVAPSVDAGAHAVKCRVHELVRVQADIFMDGHDRLAAELRWRADDEPAWHSVPMSLATNDRWDAAFRPGRIGPHAFQVAAWYDAWESYRHELEVKHAAGASLRLEREEGLQLLREADQRGGQDAPPGAGAGLIKRAQALRGARCPGRTRCGPDRNAAQPRPGPGHADAGQPPVRVAVRHLPRLGRPAAGRARRLV